MNASRGIPALRRATIYAALALPAALSGSSCGDERNLSMATPTAVERRQDARAASDGEEFPRLERLARRLDLGDEQKYALVQAFRTAAQRTRTLRREVAGATVQGEAIRDRASQIRTELRTTLQGILEPAAFSALVEKLGDGRERMAARGMERLGAHLDRRAERLGRLLRLTDTQTTQVRAALEASLPPLQSFFGAVRDGGIAWEDAFYQACQIENATRTAIRATLTPDQAARFDALRSSSVRPFFRIYL